MSENKIRARLFNKDFVILWHTQLISQFGTQAFSIAMIFWVKQVTESATLMGYLLMASMLPGAIIGPIGGVLADRYSRKKILVWSDLICGLAMLAFVVLFLVVPDNTNLLLTALFLVSIIVGMAKAFFTPAALAAIPDLVPIDKIKAANSLNQSSTQLAAFIGLSIGGVMYRILGASLLFLIDALSYIYSGIVQIFMHIPPIKNKEGDNLEKGIGAIKKDIVQGFIYIWNHRGMRKTFILASTLNFFFAPVLVVLPFYVENVLNEVTDWYGYLIASFGAGAMIGYILINVIKVPKDIRGYVMGAFFIGLSICNYLLGITVVPYLALVITFFCGVFTGFINVNIINQLQVNSSQEMRGRVFGNLTTLTAGIMPISLGLSGIIIDAIDQQVDIIFKASAIITFIVVLLVAFNKDISLFFAKELNEEDVVE